MIDERAKRGVGFWVELLVLVTVAVVVAGVVRTYVMQTFFIPSESMEHTLDIDDHVLVNKVVYYFRDPRRGEIVVFKAPAAWHANPAEEDFIKRVVGTPGDHVVCCDAQRRVTVNGQPLDESYIYRDSGGRQDRPSEDAFDIVVPAGRLWMMGDHRSQSSDSRQHWKETHDLVQSTVKIDSVVGRAFVLFWPVSRATWLEVPKTFDGIPSPPKS